MNISIKLIALAATFFLHHASAAAFAVKNDRRPACIGNFCEPSKGCCKGARCPTSTQMCEGDEL